MLITVFTPTYNREKTIRRTFESLCRQTSKCFEWLVVDDGSTDNTELIFHEFEKKADFQIRYIKKPNGGKHTAYNLALEKANGDLFFTVDSDDWLPDNSIKKILDISDGIATNNTIAGIIALKELPDKTTIGHEFKESNTFRSLRDLELSGQGGERALIFKTLIARQYPFPIIPGERFLTESVVYDQFKNYSFYIINTPLTTCEYLDGGLSSNVKQTMVNNPGGYKLYYRNRICIAKSKKELLGYILRYNAFAHLYNNHDNDVPDYNGKYKCLISLMTIFTPLVLLMYPKTSK